MANQFSAAKIELSEEERRVLHSYSTRRKTAQALALRARIVLRCAEGGHDMEVAEDLRVSRGTVGRWRRRFSEDRLEGLHDEPRPGAPRKIDDDEVERVIVATLETTPKGATHWSTRDMAKHVGVSHSSVGRIWRAFGVAPHKSETFTLSNDPLFVDKVRDIVGLYFESSRSRSRALRRREIASTGSQSKPTSVADAARSPGKSNAHLCAEWDDRSLCRLECRQWQGDRSVPPSSPSVGVPAVPRADRQKRVVRAQRARRPSEPIDAYD